MVIVSVRNTIAGKNAPARHRPAVTSTEEAGNEPSDPLAVRKTIEEQQPEVDRPCHGLAEKARCKHQAEDSDDLYGTPSSSSDSETEPDEGPDKEFADESYYLKTMASFDRAIQEARRQELWARKAVWRRTIGLLNRTNHPLRATPPQGTTTSMNTLSFGASPSSSSLAVQGPASREQEAPAESEYVVGCH